VSTVFDGLLGLLTPHRRSRVEKGSSDAPRRHPGPSAHGGRSSGARCGCVMRARLLARSGTRLPRRRRPRCLARQPHRPVRDVQRDGRRHDGHRAKVHDPDDQQDRRQTGTAVAAVEAQAQAVSPGRAGVGRQRAAAPGCLPTTCKLTCLPRGALEGAGHQDDHTHRDRYGARQRRPLHRTAASATPRGKTAIPNTVQTK